MDREFLEDLDEESLFRIQNTISEIIKERNLKKGDIAMGIDKFGKSAPYKEIYEEISTDSSIIEIEEIQNQLEEKLDDIKTTINKSVKSQVAIPVIYSSYNWYINSSNSFNPSSLIQAQRDFFGAHMVQLLNEDEFTHLDWD